MLHEVLIIIFGASPFGRTISASCKEIFIVPPTLISPLTTPSISFLEYVLPFKARFRFIRYSPNSFVLLNSASAAVIAPLKLISRVAVTPVHPSGSFVVMERMLFSVSLLSPISQLTNASSVSIFTA